MTRCAPSHLPSRQATLRLRPQALPARRGSMSYSSSVKRPHQRSSPPDRGRSPLKAPCPADRDGDGTTCPAYRPNRFPLYQFGQGVHCTGGRLPPLPVFPELPRLRETTKATTTGQDPVFGSELARARQHGRWRRHHRITGLQVSIDPNSRLRERPLSERPLPQTRLNARLWPPYRPNSVSRSEDGRVPLFRIHLAADQSREVHSRARATPAGEGRTGAAAVALRSQRLIHT